MRSDLGLTVHVLNHSIDDIMLCMWRDGYVMCAWLILFVYQALYVCLNGHIVCGCLSASEYICLLLVYNIHKSKKPSIYTETKTERE